MPRTTTRGYNTPELTGEGSDVPAVMETLAEDIDADVTGHEDSKTGVHGIPVMGAGGNGLLWTGTTWAAANIAEQAGLNGDGFIRRGKSIVATEEARTNTAYGLLTTPDRVENVGLVADGLIVIAFSAIWKESVNDAARAALFIGANQLKADNGGTAPNAQETTVGAAAGANDYSNLSSFPHGLNSSGTSGGYGTATTGVAIASYVSGGHPVGGVCYVYAAAGTYTISVQFKASSGSVTAKERKLWVWTLGF